MIVVIKDFRSSQRPVVDDELVDKSVEIADIVRIADDDPILGIEIRVIVAICASQMAVDVSLLPYAALNHQRPVMPVIVIDLSGGAPTIPLPHPEAGITFGVYIHVPVVTVHVVEGAGPSDAEKTSGRRSLCPSFDAEVMLGHLHVHAY